MTTATDEEIRIFKESLEEDLQKIKILEKGIKKLLNQIYKLLGRGK